jgi:cyclase
MKRCDRVPVDRRPALARALLTLAGSALLVLPLALRALPDGVSVIAGDGGNVTALQGADGLLLIGSFDGRLDAGTVAALGESVPRLVIDTDPDDAALSATGEGAAVLRREGAVVRSSVAALLKREARKPFKTEAAATRPMIAFASGDSFAFNGEEIGIFRVPSGLVSGASAVLLPAARTVHLGSLLTPGQYPDIDVSQGGSIAGLIAAIGRLVNLGTPDTRYLPQRGPALDRDALIAYRDMLATIRNAVRQAMLRGDGLAKIQQDAPPTTAYDAVWGQGAISGPQFIAIVHESLQNPPDDD